MEKIVAIAMVLTALVGSEALAADKLAVSWSSYTDEFNAKAELEIGTGFSMFQFGEQSHDEVLAFEQEMVYDLCDPLDITDYVMSEDLDLESFTSYYLESLGFNMDLALNVDEQTFAEFSEVLTDMAAIAEKMYVITSTGSCNGHWENSYYFFEIGEKSYSISIGVN